MCSQKIAFVRCHIQKRYIFWHTFISTAWCLKVIESTSLPTWELLNRKQKMYVSKSEHGFLPLHSCDKFVHRKCKRLATGWSKDSPHLVFPISDHFCLGLVSHLNPHIHVYEEWADKCWKQVYSVEAHFFRQTWKWFVQTSSITQFLTTISSFNLDLLKSDTHCYWINCSFKSHT